MGDVFSKIVDWVKQHPYMSLAVAGALGLLWYLYSQSQANAQAQQAAAQTGVSGPDDTIQAMEIQAGAQLQAAQISAQATNEQYGAQLQLAQLQAAAQAEQNNSQNQAALTLGLAQAGESTASILQLLGAQPGGTTIPTTVVPTTSTVTAPAGTPNATPAPTNPAPTPQLPPATTPVQAAVMQYPGSTGMNYNATEAALDPQIYEQDVTGTEAGAGSYTVNNTYYATPAATASLDQILGLQSVVAPSVVGASGGPFYNPPTQDVITPSGTVDAGQMLDELQSTPPALWTTILNGYGIQNTAGVTTQLSQLFGPNQAVPEVGATP
jgi:hypothetical protein